MEKSLDLSRRSFLKSVGIAVPTLRQVAAQAPVPAALERPVANKFSPVPLDAFFTASGADLGPREQMRRSGAAANGLIRTPGGSQAFRGIPFELGPEDTDRKSWAVLTTKPATWGSRRLEVPASGAASFVCVAAFCDWDPDETPAPTAEVTERVGQRLADVVFLYDDGTEARAPIRRRFEVNALTTPWGHLPFAAVAHRSDRPTTLNSPLGDATQWGSLQLGVWEGSYPNGPQQGPPVTVWICALPNPAPDRRLRALAFEAMTEDFLAICGITLFRGRENPLRYDRLTLYRVTLPGPASDGDGRWKATIDLGVIARSYLLHGFDAAQWLASPGPPSGQRAGPVRDSGHLYLEVSASPEATLTISDTKAGVRYEFALGEVRGEGEMAASVQGARVEVLDRQKTWLHGRVIDAGTGRPTPARLAFRSARGRYIPPYGHRSEINRGWFQDYGADVLIGDDAFAYVDGTFQVELPAGEVFVEVSKGFEYEHVRRKLDIRPGQRDLDVTIGRIADLRPRGWVSADTHVHFLSPSTAILEGQAEGLNLINLLAAQWGDLFTNVGDLPHGTLVSRDGRTLVKVGTENRQHLLGHIALINRDSDPVYPMSAAGQNESYIGDPVWTSLAEWADACRARDGLVVGMHFPYPTGELAADIVLGKIDAVELEPKVRPDPFGSLVFR
ncbi:MAG: hypothetical protein IMZ67_02420, partial [Acidobacteria bacterium]|nr:hypothetical protein [Acidobacteriota bacterium]